MAYDASSPTTETTALSAREDGISRDVRLGKYYWSLVEKGEDEEKNEKLAVEAFLRAAIKGDESATTYLRERVYAASIGITEANRADVEWCITTSSDERRVREATRRLFTKINMARHKLMTVAEYVGAVDATKLLPNEKSMLKDIGTKLGDKFNEEEFVDAVANRMQGRIETKRREHPDSSDYSKSSLIEKMSKFPKESAQDMLDKGMDYVSSSGFTLVTTFLPYDRLYLLFTLIIYSFITSSFIFRLVPLLVFYVSAATMVITTLKMVNSQRHLANMSAWADLLQSMDVGIDIDSAKSQFSWKSLKPYVAFFTSLVTTLVGFSLADKNWIPCSELCVLAAGLAVASFVALSDNYDHLLLLSVSCNVLASLPVFFKHFPQIPIIIRLVNFISQPFFSVPIGPFLLLNIGIPTVLYAIIPVFFVVMATRISWQGTYRILIPHLVCYFWWNITAIVFPYTTWLGLGRATIGYLFLPILVPVGIIVALYYSLIFAFQVIQSSNFAKILVAFILLAIPAVLYKSKSLFKTNKGSRSAKALKIFFVIFGIFSLLPLAFIEIPSFKPPSFSTLSYDQFADSCITDRGGVNHIERQMKCYHLKGSKVKWEGKVTSIKITTVSNSYEDALSFLPEMLSKPLKCLYGEKYDCKNTTAMERSKQEVCVLMIHTNRNCHLRSHDLYKFQVDVEMEGGSQVKLTAGHKFHTTLGELSFGDKVNFTAVLNANLGQGIPTLVLKMISCTTRELSPSDDESLDADESFIAIVNELITVLLHFFMYPMVEYVPIET